MFVLATTKVTMPPIGGLATTVTRVTSCVTSKVNEEEK